MSAGSSSFWSTVVADRLGRFDQLERRLCVVINRNLRTPGMVALLAAVSRLGDGWIWYALMIILALGAGLEGLVAALQMGVTALVSVALYKFLKHRLVRERPFVVSPDITLGTAPLDRYSFPSGHTMHAVMFTVIAVHWFPALAVVLIPFAVLVALSRVVLGLHYPSDVVAGGLLGWGLAELALWLWPVTDYG
ncbi:MAG: phosphatase PAP2 family protein [Wenzhouxiangellaceae bacterium]